ncbi:hypothetical protein STAS_06166 [Striga asiatica]|uniref:Uncharacterized protein n=1 Tax=Striga asiatica TaxID=4170 RepID=A0A5A7PCG6_STRAF|nr:hypothetical protein STAS_06166 [Striga asiatica]
MENIVANERLTILNSSVERDDDEDETLSLSALPLIPKNDQKQEKFNTQRENQIHDDFDFCSLSKESQKMRTADEIFFRGQILPLHHCPTRPITRSESMDRPISSRSSSSGSRQSSTSSGSSAGPKFPPPRNRFHSHPSPSPRSHFPVTTNRRNSSAKASPAWSIFRLGMLAAPPEISFQGLKPRARRIGSRNSTESCRSSAGSRSSLSRFRKNLSSIGGCKCSGDAIDTVRSRVMVITRSSSEGECVEVKNRAAKKRLSYHRTSEWLKQLSLEEDEV